MPGDLFAKAEDYSVQPPALHTPTVRFVRYLTPIITACMRQLYVSISCAYKRVIIDVLGVEKTNKLIDKMGQLPTQ